MIFTLAVAVALSLIVACSIGVVTFIWHGGRYTFFVAAPPAGGGAAPCTLCWPHVFLARPRKKYPCSYLRVVSVCVMFIFGFVFKGELKEGTNKMKVGV